MVFQNTLNGNSIIHGHVISKEYRIIIITKEENICKLIGGGSVADSDSMSLVIKQTRDQVF